MKGGIYAGRGRGDHDPISSPQDSRQHVRIRAVHGDGYRLVSHRDYSNPSTRAMVFLDPSYSKGGDLEREFCFQQSFPSHAVKFLERNLQASSRLLNTFTSTGDQRAWLFGTQFAKLEK